jgi:hypothetical protein
MTRNVLSKTSHGEGTIIKEGGCLFNRCTAEHGNSEDLCAFDENRERIDRATFLLLDRLLKAADEVLCSLVDDVVITRYLICWEAKVDLQVWTHVFVAAGLTEAIARRRLPFKRSS